MKQKGLNMQTISFFELDTGAKVISTKERKMYRFPEQMEISYIYAECETVLILEMAMKYLWYRDFRKFECGENSLNPGVFYLKTWKRIRRKKK